MARPKPRVVPDTPDEIEQQFYEAMQSGDVERLMAVWSDDEEICCVHPGGARLIGAAAIRAAFESLFGNGAINVQLQSVRRLQRHDSAVHSVLEHIPVMTEAGPREAWIVVTNVYVRGPMGWRMVAHHASPGSAAVGEEFAEAGTVLH